MSEAHCNDLSDADRIADLKSEAAVRTIFDHLKAQKDRIERHERENALPKVIMCDMDGTMVKHKGNIVDMVYGEMELLPDVRERFAEWFGRGWQIWITTGRPESARQQTTEQLIRLRVPYHRLLMDVPIGVRVVINDRKSADGIATAVAFCVARDEGLVNVKI